MKIAIRYYSKTGNTKKLANAIGEALQVNALDITKPLDEDVDILFLGSSVYGARVADEVKTFIHNIDVHIGKVVNFSTAALLPSTYNQISKLVAEKAFIMAEEEFHCRGSFKMMHKGKPDANDLKDVSMFAKRVAGNV